jgi:hypothetical protein
VAFKLASIDPISRFPWHFIFAPFWIGNSILGIVQVRLIFRVGACLGNGRIVSEHDYRMLRLNPLLVAVLADVITDEQIHLVSRGIIGTLVSIPALVLITTTEILLCSNLESGKPAIWTCLSPVLIIQFAAVVVFVLIKTNSIRSGVVNILSLFTTLSIGFRVNMVETAGTSPTSWLIVLIPLFCLNAVFGHLVGAALVGHVVGDKILRVQQLLAAVLYLTGIVLLTAGEVALAQHPYAGGDIVNGLWLPLGTVYFGSFLFSVAVLIIIGEHGEWLLATKGFADPLPMCLTEGGWGPAMGEADSYELALGIVVRRVQPQFPLVVPLGQGRGNAVSSIEYGVHTVHSDQYDSGCDSAAFADIYGGNTTGASGAEESS